MFDYVCYVCTWVHTYVPIMYVLRDAKNSVTCLRLHLLLRIVYINTVITIRKTCPCNEYPFKPHFYIVKVGYAGVYLFFLFLLQNIDCGYSLEPPRRGGSNVYPQSMF